MIKNIDCLVGLKMLDDNSVDLVFFDPPYNKQKDYGIFKDDLPEEEYETLLKIIINESLRVSKRGIGVYTPYTRLDQFKKLIPNHETIIIKKLTPSIWKSKLGVQTNTHYILFTCEATRNVTNLWTDIRVPGDGFYFHHQEKKFSHPGQTALKATKRFIDSFSLAGEIILDPYMGIGTTAVACKQLNRKWIGFEINPEYIKIARKRLRQKILNVI